MKKMLDEKKYFLRQYSFHFDIPSLLSIFLLLLTWIPIHGYAVQVRIKDIVNFEGVRENVLIGYGLVVGLQGTGDKLNTALFTRESLAGMLNRLGVSVDTKNLKTKNIAAVIVTATLPSFARQGTRIDISVSAMGDASSLAGGSLLVTPLLAADGNVYAVAQGSLIVEGFSAKGSAARIMKGVQTTAKIANGAIVEREIPFVLNELKSFKMTLKNPDFTTAKNISSTINEYMGKKIAFFTDQATIELKIPENFGQNVAELIASIEPIEVDTDSTAKIIVHEHTGVIVMTEHLNIDTVAVALGGITIKISNNASEDSFFSREETTTTTSITVDETNSGVTIVNHAPSLQDLVKGFNLLGITPRDIISILQAMKAAGAIQAQIVVV